jgi:hypothetical protein
MRFSPKGLIPFKIQTNFILDLFPEFLIQNLEGFEVGQKMKKIPIELISHHAKFEFFWTFGRS